MRTFRRRWFFCCILTSQGTKQTKIKRKSFNKAYNNENMEDKDMRHIIVRSILGIIWIIVGVVGFATAKVENGLFCSVMGVLFLFTAFKMWKKNKQGEK